MAARWISIIAHPFVIILVWIAAVTVHLRGIETLTENLGLVLLLVVVPNAVFMVRQVRRGAWEHVDGSRRHERFALYAVGLATVAILVGWLAWREPDSILLRGATVALALLTVSALTSRRIKVSLHVAAAALAATSLLWLRSPVGWFLAASVPLLAWSRLKLGRHRPVEVALGCAYGALAGVAIHAP